MTANDFYSAAASKLKEVWRVVRSQTQQIMAVTAVAIVASFYAGFALQRQTKPSHNEQQLEERGSTHLRLTDWVAEFYSCPKDSIEGQCKRVLKKLSNGTYQVASERLPLGRGQFVSSSQFSANPTHVRLSRRITDEEAKEINKKWPKEKPILALAGQPVCEGGKCSKEDIIAPLARFSLADKSWVQFDSHIASNGQYGPQNLPPLLVAQNKAHQIFSTKSNFQRGLFFELGLAMLAPLFALALTFWAGQPPIYVALTQLLAARAVWTLSTTDTFAQQSVMWSVLSLRSSYALAAFFTGWVVAATANFLSEVWSKTQLKRRGFVSTWAVTSLVVLSATYLIPAGGTSAIVFMRAIESAILVLAGCFCLMSYVASTQLAWNGRIAEFIRDFTQGEESPRWRNQIKALTCSFFAGGVVGLWLTVEASNSIFVINWAAVIIPICLTVVLMYSRPQLTSADLQVQKDHLQQQELLVKLMSQLGTCKHRTQAISLVVNFCNRELPKLGFEAPQFVEHQPQSTTSENTPEFEVMIDSPVRGPHQTFGWIIARARKRSETTAMGERIIEALTSVLAQQLDILIRNSLLESEVSSAQKFVPRDLIRVFGINNISSLDANHEHAFAGTIVNVVMKNSATRGRDAEQLPDRAIVLELTQLFTKAANDLGGYIFAQDGLRWSLVFRDTSHSALRWIEATQIAMRNWNQHRQSLSMSLHECSFGAHSGHFALRFSESSGVLRPWIIGDMQNISATLAEVAADYCATTLLSLDYLNALTGNKAANTLPDGIRPLDRVWNKNKTATVDVFEFFGGDSDLRRAAKQRSVELFAQGVRLYLTGYFDGAKSIMSQIFENDPNDKAAQRLLAILSQGEDLKAA